MQLYGTFFTLILVMLKILPLTITNYNSEILSGSVKLLSSLEQV